jgi:hypothetical protein
MTEGLFNVAAEVLRGIIARGLGVAEFLGSSKPDGKFLRVVLAEGEETGIKPSPISHRATPSFRPVRRPCRQGGGPQQAGLFR